MEQRIIKFRGWDGRSMITPCCELKEHNHFWGEDYVNTPFNSPIAVMQFTGFFDKNNVEVYEGDIFRVEEDGDEIDTQDRIYYLVVVWVKEWGMFCTLRIADEYWDYTHEGIKAIDEPMFWTYTLEDTNDRRFFLAGNVYQNPELLKRD